MYTRHNDLRGMCPYDCRSMSSQWTYIIKKTYFIKKAQMTLS